ncbi:sigma-54 interaction domain-containing protein [Aneurinibacillus tyrosinisolvens]|uniref:sigma-54 interaction domain-containing protein n=1 Tax=Aneurinibacillus tyrosinisolvens TaxID=1443435 RepID=UPI00063FBF9E|nr:sigma 54-interacting transcriptional regulator [Aneurinibacillus tyrosinisolvens]
MGTVKELTLLTGTRETSKALASQLHEILGDIIHIHSYSLEEGIPLTIKKQLVILSTHLIQDEVKDYIGKNCEIIIANRTINHNHIDKLLFLPKGSKALYVNDFPETASESIDTLLQLGIDHIEYIPYYPGARNVHPIEIAITPGEIGLVPSFVKNVIDIGPRLIDITTLMAILERLKLLEQKGTEVSEKYTRKIIELSKKLADSSKETDQLNKYLHQVLNGVDDGIIAVNHVGEITVFNENLEKILQTSASKVLGKKVEDMIQDKDLASFISTDSNEEENRWFTVGQAEVVVHRFVLSSERSIVATFKNARETIHIEKTLRRELVKKGYIARHTFESIVGSSDAIQSTMNVAKKLARTDLTVLIQGESGTGKELFPSAIHNDSLRSEGPFLAVNFSALPEELVESELFGCEEGAFTGAKKGGKAGLFEQVNGGTIFLDEIGDISLKIQTRLLRVLQEKEIMRVGGSKIIPIDVRIIAATNKDLLTMIEQGTFREDLYYRLKVLFLPLPELRNRKEDIALLIHTFIHQSGRKVTILPEVIEQLMRYEWYGNVRELKNTLDYMLAVCEGDTITMNDIPNEFFFQRAPSTEKQHLLPPARPVIEKEGLPAPFDIPQDAEEYVFILQTIADCIRTGESIGRKKIAERSRQWQKTLSEQQIRHRLQTLEDHGYVVKSKGPAGLKLTRTGFDFISSDR